jgi:S1-C subfamily serine protease
MNRFCFTFLSAAFLAALPVASGGPEQAVVKILNFSQQPDWKEPWRFSQVNQSSGSGFVIEGKRIMTNAHVVSWSKHILVQRYQDPQPYQAEIEFIGHDCDLAVLRVNDPNFFDGIEPLPIGDLPEVRSSVTTYGYPAGGQQISYTRGVISRIEMQRYSHIYNRSLLAVQTDAAINPGNSGGPALQDEKVVGVSFQGRPGLENAGFFIPPNIIRHFLKDIEDGHYHGFPDAGIGITKLQNPAFRRSLGLEDDSSGARIDTL